METTGVLLVGGMGTRLRPAVSSMPKALASVGGRPFLELLVFQLRNQGIRRLVMCTGYLAGQIEEHFGDGRSFGVEISYSKETEALGTAGALKLAEQRLAGGGSFLVMNGDSFLEADLHELVRFHAYHGAAATVAVRRVENTRRYGSVLVNSEGRIAKFEEKRRLDEPGLVNGGVYVFQPSVLDRIPSGPSSLERDVFPSLLADGMYAFEQHGLFIDIGTPEDYTRAQEMYRRLCDAAIEQRG
jgi:NDP-sugar pyrophosphorylase family protein